MFDFVRIICDVEPVEGLGANFGATHRDTDDDEDNGKAKLEEGRQFFLTLQEVILPQQYRELARAHTHDVTASNNRLLS